MNFDFEVILSVGKCSPNMFSIYEMFISRCSVKNQMKKNYFCFLVFWTYLTSFDVEVILSLQENVS